MNQYDTRQLHGSEMVPCLLGILMNSVFLPETKLIKIGHAGKG